MKVLVYLPIDAIVKTWARLLEADGHEVESTHAFSVFRRRSRWADWTLLNASKTDAPRYVWKMLLSVLYARLAGRRVAVFVSIDLVDLCDRPVLRALLWGINWLVLRNAALVILLAQREHVARRYGLPAERLLLVYNCPDREAFVPGKAKRPDESQAKSLCHPHESNLSSKAESSQAESLRYHYKSNVPSQAESPRYRPGKEGAGNRPVTFLYHGELLWWHGLEQFLPIYEEIKKRRPARLIVTGNFYPTVFRVFGLVANGREVAVKQQLKTILEREDVEYRGRLELDQLRQEMAAADFHVSQLNDRDVMGQTELRTCLLEAMAAGMVCLHAPTPGLPRDVFHDGQNIVLIDPRDPRAAAEKILRLIESPERLEAIRQSAVQTIAERFDLRAEYRKAVGRLEEILAQKS